MNDVDEPESEDGDGDEDGDAIETVAEPEALVGIDLNAAAC